MSTAEVPTLRGREYECAAIESVIREARIGQSRVLVLRGEPGIGKSALLDHASTVADGCRVVRAVGVESESDFPFSGLHQLCAPLIHHLELLPGPQREALAVAFGILSGEPPDRFLVGVAVLTLLALEAESAALVCLVDDAQWLDSVSMQLVGFVARRLLAERIAVVLAVRSTYDPPELRGLPTREIEGISEQDSLALLGPAIADAVDPSVVRRILAETAGNPLALLELRNRHDPAELVFSVATSRTVPQESRLELSYARRIEALPADTRRLLNIAAAEPSGDTLLFWRAAEHLGVPAAAATPLDNMELLDIGPMVRFRHPLIRTAAYRTAEPDERRRVHGALGHVTDPDSEPDRRAWHRAQAATGPDDLVAAELATAATRARARGGWAAAATFLEKAATLTLDPAQRAERHLHAAQARRHAGSLDAALRLLASVDAGPRDDRRAAEAVLLRALIALDQRRGRDAARLFLDAATLLERVDHTAARRAHLQALGAALWAGRNDGVHGLTAVAEAVRSSQPDGVNGSGPLEATIYALTKRFIDGYPSSAAQLDSTLQRFIDIDPTEDDDENRWLWHAGARAVSLLAIDLWDDERWHAFATRQVQLHRDLGALLQVQFPLYFLSMSHLLAGNLLAAAHLMEEDAAIGEATGAKGMAHVSMAIAAWSGNEAAFRPHYDEALREATAREQTRVVTFTQTAGAVLNNGLGAHEAAHAFALAAFRTDVIGNSPFAIPEVIESAYAEGDGDTLEEVLEWLEARSKAAPTPLLLGIQFRARALLSDDETADRHHVDSIRQLRLTRSRAQEARGHLLRGTFLRRVERREEARQALRIAFDMLTDMGMNGFAERAGRELRAMGQRVPSRRERPVAEALTAQEAQIAALARDGLTNAEIGAQLFISPRTVEWHLRKVYEKFRVKTRRELRQPMIEAGLGGGDESGPGIIRSPTPADPD